MRYVLTSAAGSARVLPEYRQISASLLPGLRFGLCRRLSEQFDGFPTPLLTVERGHPQPLRVIHVPPGVERIDHSVSRAKHDSTVCDRRV